VLVISRASAYVSYLPDVSHSFSSPLSDAERIVQLEQKLAWAELKIQALEAQLRLQRIQKYGPGSEKLSDANWCCWSSNLG